MSDSTEQANSVITGDDTISRTAGRQLLGYAVIAIIAMALLMMGLSWASSLTSSSQGSSTAVDPVTRTITSYLRTEPPQLDHSRATDETSIMVLGHVLEGLLRYDEHGKLVGGVAERWEIRDTGATFWLRDPARWSDGVPITAHDFVFAWRTAVDPATAAEYAFIMFAVKNGRAINEGKLPPETLGVRARDNLTLEVEFERPIAHFDKLTAFVVYYPKREDFYHSTNGRYGADVETMLYNGPFVMTTWVHGAHVRLEKNEHYWDKDRIKIEAIDFPYVTSDTRARLNLFKDDKIAYAVLDTETLDPALEQRWRLTPFPDGSVYFTEFNHREERLTSNRHLRKAFQYASNPAEVVYKVTKIPGYLPGESLFPVWLQGVEKPFRQEYPPPKVEFDLDKARWHLEQAKLELGVDEFPPLVLLCGDNPLSTIQSEYFQSVYKRHLGIDLKIDKQIFKQRLAKMTAGDFDMVLAGWGPDFDDPLTFGDLFASWNLNNRGRYENPELDRWVAVAQESLDTKTRMDAFGEIQRIIIDDAVVLPMYERGQVYVTSKEMTGLLRRVVGPDPDYSNIVITTPVEG